MPLPEAQRDQLVGYVSDEWYFALAGVDVDFSGPRGTWRTTSTAAGAVFAELPAGEYAVSIAAAGYGAKRTAITLPGTGAVQFRLLSDRPYGYVWPKWGPSGSTGELRVHAAVDYEMSLWRYGWEREHIADLGYFEDHPRGSVRQILPDGDVAAIGACWNDFGYSFPPVDPRVHVTAPARSGLYYVHVRDVEGRHTAFPWVVSPSSTPTEGTRIAVLASTLTWNAYNDFGGRSNYTAPKSLPARPTVNARQEGVWFTDPEFQPWDELHYEPLSFNRPEPVNRVEWGEEITDPIRIRGGEHVAPAEWRLLGWLEREGFDYDLFADVKMQPQV